MAIMLDILDEINKMLSFVGCTLHNAIAHPDVLKGRIGTDVKSWWILWFWINPHINPLSELYFELKAKYVFNFEAANAWKDG